VEINLTSFLFYYITPDRLMGFIFWGGVLHVTTYAVAGLADRFFFGPYTDRNSKNSLAHDLLCLFLELINFRKAVGNIFLLGGIALYFRSTDNLNLTLGLEQSAFIGFFVYILSFDFLLYWYHRMSHRGFLWVQHSYHHSASSLNPLSDIRIHALSFPFLFFLVLLPVSFVYRLGPFEIVAFHWLANIISILAHSRWDTDYGWVGRYILVSPRYHRLHHSVTPSKHMNFGTYFVIWDRIFGTYQMPSRDEKLIPGLNKDEDFGVIGSHPIVGYIKIFPAFINAIIDNFAGWKSSLNKR
jgi:sterol desaturase/sphingolipid hydroxylase (fatty acid hydroxylase superfamily)